MIRSKTRKTKRNEIKCPGSFPSIATVSIPTENLTTEAFDDDKGMIWQSSNLRIAS